MGAAHLREPVGRALDHPQLPALGAPEQVLQRRVDHLGRPLQAVHKPEPDDRPALAHERAVATWLGSPEAIP